MNTPNQEKFELLANAYTKLPFVNITFNPKLAGNQIPVKLISQDSAMVQVGNGLAAPTNDLELSEEGVHVTLRFNGIWQPCVILWDAIYCIYFEWQGRQQGKIWEGSVPEAVRKASEKNKPEVSKVVKTRPTAEAARVQQPDGTYSLAQFKANREARATPDAS